jgi:imidazolonepropionase-like amidohydrolase
MRRYIFFLVLLIPLKITAQTDNAPVTGVSDKRAEVYGLRNAKVIVDYLTTIENADILVSDGRIKEIGKNLVFPKGTIVYDLTGKTIYPSFIDLYAANYGVRTQSSTAETGQSALMTAARQTGRQPATETPRTADYWNDGINASYDVSEELIPDTRIAGEYRQAGFGAVLALKADGIARGTSALVATGEGKTNNLLIKNKASANYSFSRGRSEDSYPSSQFGIIALLRQFFYDAQWYSQLPPGYFHDDGLEAYNKCTSLPQIFEVTDKLEIMRIDRIGKEFNISFIIKGSGDEYQALNDIKKTGVRLILPVNFPEAPDVKDPFDAAAVNYITLKHYEMAPANLAFVSGAGLTFTITSSDLRRRSDFLANLRKAVRYGLPETDALKALTYTPASMIGVSDLVGSLRKNMLANFLVTSGNIFSENTVIYENWVLGKPYRLVDLRLTDLRGKYSLKVDTAEYNMVLSGVFNKPSIKLMVDSTEIRGASFTLEKDLVGISFERAKTKFRLSGYIAGKDMEGKGQTDAGKWITWKAAYKDISPEQSQTSKPSSKPEIGKVIYPFAPYGSAELPVQEDMLFKNATVWTNEKEGILQNTDVLVKGGRIARIGKDLKPDGAKVIDCTGKHLTSGIIDEHSHIAASSTNESAQAITSEVRIGDVINPENINIYRQLSGGVTAAHILHGSANPIGGQSALIKHRWGHSAEELKIANQVGFLKHALGENVKRSTSRYPVTRMGVDQIIRDAYFRAVDYNHRWKAWNALKPAEKVGKVPPRRDLELDAIVDVLEKRSFIECHTYVQSEGTMIMKLAEDFGLKVNSLIHFNEGYKVADQIARGGHGASVFSDWWDYKYEVYEGIPYNASMLLSQGVLTCLHSDDAEMGRRLNQEAAKTVKYGGVSETEALKLVTLNPAKLLHLDDRMGSIKVGKDADLVVWSGHPLSVYSRALKTVIDGTVYFDEDTDALLREQISTDRNRIIANILREPSQTSTSSTPNMPRR